MNRDESRELLGSALRSILPAVALGGSLAVLGVLLCDLPLAWLFRSLVLLLLGAYLVVAGVQKLHPYPRMGAGNQVTLARAVLVALLAGLIGEPQDPTLQWLVAALAAVASLLDFLDGRLARRQRMESPFGARFDMETDALLILVLSLLAWQSGKAGAWILICGLLRYAFIAGSEVLPWMRRALAPSQRRRAVAALQMLCLVLVLVPAIASPWSDAIAAVALLALLASFASDVRWLARHRHAAHDVPAAEPRWVLPLAALLLLNGALTFHNVWPTLFIRWPGELSLELAAVMLGLATLSAWRPPPRALLAALAFIWLLLALARYGAVTAPALYGREVNLYWDLQHVGALGGMLTRVMPAWAVLLAILGTLLVLSGLYLILRWAFGRLAATLQRPAPRRVLTLCAVLAVVLFTVQRLDDRVPRHPQFSTPVSSVYAQQLRRIAATYAVRHGIRSIPASPPLADANLAELGGADVMLVFLESYGRITYDRPEMAAALRDSRARLAADIGTSGRGVVSAYVRSPTFGGGSWLAHITLLTGIGVQDPDLYELLMTQHRPTLVSALQGKGYRAVGLMPGMRQAWPEGRFYGYDALYDAGRIDYRGPEFGWWRIPDQFSLAQLDARERVTTDAIAARRAPLFVVFPTINTHTPFRPTPPYQPDWSRMLTAQPFDAAELHASIAMRPEWSDLGASYVASVAYTFDTLGGYLREHAAHDVVMIVLGDHQPPAAVSGTDASWDVPVHVIASNPRILEQLRAAGFVDGLTPAPATAGRMEQLTQWLLAAFSRHGAPPSHDAHGDPAQHES